MGEVRWDQQSEPGELGAWIERVGESPNFRVPELGGREDSGGGWGGGSEGVGRRDDVEEVR